MHGKAKFYYYPTDVLKDEMEFVFGVKAGWHIHYRKDGKIESRVYFGDNVQNGNGYWYYSDGKLELENYKVNGKSYGLLNGIGTTEIWNF